jgi:protein-S-isoprenylcysteine O-methyltransferase Ste14
VIRHPKFALALLLLLLALPPASALGQACAMCRANAKATPKEAQRAINHAIFLMMVPPLAAVTLGTGLIVRYARRRDEENGLDS